jgi:hypothetical protein
MINPSMIATTNAELSPDSTTKPVVRSDAAYSESTDELPM